MTKRDNFIAGIGAGLLIAALTVKLFDVSWLVVACGAILLIVGGTGVASKKSK